MGEDQRAPRSIGFTVALIAAGAVAVVASWWANAAVDHPGLHPFMSSPPIHAMAYPGFVDDGEGATPFERIVAAFQPAPRAPSASPALERYQSATSMRKFVLDTLAQAPGREASYYAAQALYECLTVIETTDVLTRAQAPFDVTDSDVTYKRRNAAWDFYRKRCADFVPDEMPDMARRLELKSARAHDGRDAVASAADRWNESHQRGAFEDLRNAMGETLRLTPHPLLADLAGWDVLLPSSAGGQPSRDDDKGRTFKYKRRTYEEDKDPEMFKALDLLPCGSGLRCDAREGRVGLDCARGGDCKADRFDAMKNGLAADCTDESTARTLGYYEQLVSSITSRSKADFD